MEFLGPVFCFIAGGAWPLADAAYTGMTVDEKTGLEYIGVYNSADFTFLVFSTIIVKIFSAVNALGFNIPYYGIDLLKATFPTL